MVHEARPMQHAGRQRVGHPHGTAGVPISDDPDALVPLTVGARPPRALLRSDAEVRSLNGRWRFALTPNAEGLDLSERGEGWDEIDVPGHWQLQGHGSPTYTNVRYPFPVEPPHVPDDNPTGEYRRDVALTAADLARDGRWVLRFLGVDSCLRLAVNGVEVGQHTGSRLPVEFDLTDHLRAGDNLLAVRVHRWSAGSYLEDQDQWRLSGITRDVDLLFRPAGGPEDVRVRADHDPQTGRGTLRVTAWDAAGQPLDATVLVPDLGVEARTGQTVLVAASPWTAETPVLYDATVSTPTETVTLRLGFRRVEVRDGLLLVNGRRVQFRGVNRHDVDAHRGRAVTDGSVERDLLTMKAHHLNAVRTSHYPPPPVLVDLADELGLYVVVENDYETHGFELEGWGGNPSDDPRWRRQCLDRIERTVRRDVNHPSVVMWSLGNEAGVGSNITAMADWVRSADASRPVHYEPDAATADVDVYSRMYATHAEVEAVGRRAEPALPDLAADAARRGKPFVLCEYAHAMGNGPGGLAEYDELFERYPRCQGGFVWEFVDHALAVPHGDGERLAYGGDFGEVVHDGSFVVDGLLFPDRTPSPGMVELAAVNAPVRVRVGDAAVEVTNRRQFAPLDDVALVWRCEDDGRPVADGELALPDLPAGATARLALPTGMPPVGDGVGERWLTVEAVTREASRWAPAGHRMGLGQRRLAVPPVARPTGGSAERPVQVAGGWRVGPAQLDARGRLVRLGGVAVVEAHVDAWRAPTENDQYVGWDRAEAAVTAWRRVGLDRLTERLQSVEADMTGVTVRSRWAAAATAFGLRVAARWSAPEAGSVRLDLELVPEGRYAGTLPRLGWTMAMDVADAPLARVEWFGTGPGESYPDSAVAAVVGRYGATVAELQTPYVVPQENGCRRAVRDAVLTWEGGGLEVTGHPWVDLTVRPWSTRALEAATHRDELRPDGLLWLHVDAGQDGLGTATCGPGVLPQHEFRPGPTQLSITFRPA